MVNCGLGGHAQSSWLKLAKQLRATAARRPASWTMYWLASRRPRYAQPPPAEAGQLSPRGSARRTERPGATSSTSSTVTNRRTPTSQFDRCVSAVLAACLRAARERV